MNEKTETAPVHAVVHTPGPWIVMDAKGEDGSTGLYVSAPNGDVCDLYSHRRDEHGMPRGLVPFIGAERNARLIAAAPDLLAACKAGLRACLASGYHGPVGQIERAIAKAESVV